MKLSDSGSMREYIKDMTETFDELAARAEPITDEDKVVYLLAGLPDTYDVLVTALESGLDAVLALEIVTERSFREEQKLKDKEETEGSKRFLVVKRNSLRVTIARSLDTLRRTAESSLLHSQAIRVKVRRKLNSRKGISHLRMPCLLVGNAHVAAKSRHDWIVDSGGH